MVKLLFRLAHEASRLICRPVDVRLVTVPKHPPKVSLLSINTTRAEQIRFVQHDARACKVPTPHAQNEPLGRLNNTTHTRHRAGGHNCG